MALLMAGCATGRQSASRPADIDTARVVAKTPPTVFRQPLSLMHAVVLEAMESMGCRLSLDTTSHLKGRLPTGEIVDVFLKSAGEPETQLWVDTTKTFVGGAWQTSRNQEVLNSIRHALDRQ